MKPFIKYCLLLLLPASIYSQGFKEVSAAYPQHDAVFLKYHTTLRLFLKDDVPVAESIQLEDLMMLSDKNANLYSRSRVYHSGFGELKSLDAYTLMPDGKKKVYITEKKTTSSTSNAVFYDDVKETSFDFPLLSQGAIAHMEYTRFHKDAHLLSPLSFGSSIPGVSVEFSAIVPDDITIQYIVKNDPANLMQFTSERKRGQTIYKWSMANVTNPTHYNDAPDYRYYQPHVIVYVTGYKTKAGIQPFIRNVDDLYAWNASFTKTLNQEPDAALQKITDSLVAGKASQIEKAKAIYKWVQQNIRYVAFENGLEGFRPRQAAEVCSKRYGDCKDMSSIITQMLRMAGIKAYYTWIGTRDIPYAYTEVPLPIVDNHMISAAEIDGQWYFLDGTSPNAKLNLPPDVLQGKQALLGISSAEHKILEVPTTPAAVNSMEDSTFLYFTANGVAGFESVTYKGYFGEDIYNALLYRDEKGRKDYVKTRMGKASNKFMLGDFDIHFINREENIAGISAKFEIPDYGKKIGNEFYINLNLEKLFENQLIDTAKRKVPKELSYLFDITQHHILEIPSGYKVSYKPDNLDVENEFYKLSITYTVNKNNIIATQRLTNKTLMVEPSKFALWNKPLPKVQSHYKEQIVLEKN